MKVLVAGDRGYIGAVLVPFLRTAGHQVQGLDLGLYEGCDFGSPPEQAADRLTADIRDVQPADLAGYDAVVCLAALSNDPLGHLNPAATFSVNLDGTMRLATAAKQAGVPRFLFASSCSLYGAAGSAGVAEDADLVPVTPYGETKALAERQLSLLAGESFSPTYLRNATAYGNSPRLRLDIVVNNLTAVATTTGQVRMESDGSPWRPLVHVEDICRAFLAVLEAPVGLVHDQAFNVGRQEDNVQVRQIAELVNSAVPGSRISFAKGAGPDIRNYRVDFSKLNETFPDLRLSWSVAAGVDELASAYLKHGLTLEDFESSRYVRLRRIRELLKADMIDDMLLRKTASPLAALALHV
ncbi:MAG TPA: SDR family oxidoreductase [Streptosporangiaceae bacterium]|nr:SDR family oxidoreductase [Streptosporangiaceae bacterium]